MSHDGRVTAVLITREDRWPENISPDWALGERVGFPHSPFGEVILETRCTGVHRRFELAARAKHDIVYVQDDDVQVDIMRLWKYYNGQLTYAIPPGFKVMYDALSPRVCLIGWGAFFPRRFADPARWQPYVDAHGPVPSHEADRVFTYFCDQPHNPVYTQVRLAERGQAMSRDNPDHYRSRDRIIKQLTELA